MRRFKRLISDCSQEGEVHHDYNFCGGKTQYLSRSKNLLSNGTSQLYYMEEDRAHHRVLSQRKKEAKLSDFKSSTARIRNSQKKAESQRRTKIRDQKSALKNGFIN